MKLRFMYCPVDDLATAVRYYRDELGFEEAWREGESTAAFHLPGTQVQLMLDEDSEGTRRTGGFFEVEDVDAFYEERREELTFLAAPYDIPPGRHAMFEDPAGSHIYIFDLSHEE